VHRRRQRKATGGFPKNRRTPESQTGPPENCVRDI